MSASTEAAEQKISIGKGVSTGNVAIHCTHTDPVSCCAKPTRLEAMPADSGASVTALAVTFGSAMPCP